MKEAAPWLAGFTQRWHVQPSLASTGDRVDGHSARVGILILHFHPGASAELLRAALVHDLGESQAGDVPYPVKKKYPDLSQKLEEIEAITLAGMGMIMPKLTKHEQEIFRFCDRLDAYLWALHHRPLMVVNHQSWIDYKKSLKVDAKYLGFEVPLYYLIKDIENGSY